MRSTASRLKQADSKQSGQSTLEFTLTLLLVLAFTFFYFQLTTVFAYANYVHYAVFMSARAYLAAGPDESDQQLRANNVMEQTLLSLRGEKYQRFGRGDSSKAASGNIPGLKIGQANQFQPNRANGWLEGVQYSFRSKLFLMPLARSKQEIQSGGRGLASPPMGSNADDPNGISLTAETFLGREPTYRECTTDLSTKGKNGGAAIYDNGC